jgi:hypothetical protein
MILGIFFQCYPDLSQSQIEDVGGLECSNQKLYYHLIGTEQEEDILIAEFPQNPNYMM